MLWELSKRQPKKKEENIAFLKSNNIPVSESLPIIEAYDEAVLRSKEDVAKRAIALLIAAVYAECIGADMDFAESQTLQHNLKSRFEAHQFFTAKETFFLLASSPDKHMAIQFSWQYECLNVMLWALGFIDNLTFPDDICDVPKIAGIINRYETFDSFLYASAMRDKEEILDEADLIYRYNWACVDARINSRDIDSLNSGVVMERHRALNWLINYCNQDWDDVTTDT